MRATGTSHVADTAADTAAAAARTQAIAPAVPAASGGLSGRAGRDFRRFLEAFKNGVRPRLGRDGLMAAVGRPRRLSGGTGLAGPAQLVLWGHAERHGSVSDGCWEPRCASARAFVLSIN